MFWLAGYSSPDGKYTPQDKDPNGDTYLHKNSKAGLNSVIKSLLMTGCQVNATNNLNQTAVSMYLNATREGDLSGLTFLVRYALKIEKDQYTLGGLLVRERGRLERDGGNMLVLLRFLKIQKDLMIDTDKTDEQMLYAIAKAFSTDEKQGPNQNQMKLLNYLLTKVTFPTSENEERDTAEIQEGILKLLKIMHKKYRRAFEMTLENDQVLRSRFEKLFPMDSYKKWVEEGNNNPQDQDRFPSIRRSPNLVPKPDLRRNMIK